MQHLVLVLFLYLVRSPVYAAYILAWKSLLNPCRFVGRRYLTISWVPEVFLALLYEDELYRKPRMKHLWHPG